MNAQQSIDLPDFGLRFTIPTGWSGSEQGDFVVLGHASIPGMMVLSANQVKDATSLKQLAEAGWTDEGVQLTPSGAFRTIGNARVEGYYEGWYDASEVRCYAIGLINGLGEGMNIFVLTTKQLFSEVHVQAANKLASSVQFYKAKDSDLTRQWKKQLVGRQLKYMYSNSTSDYSGGYSSVSETRVIDLCSNGRFAYSHDSNSSFAAGDPVDGITTGNQIGSGVFDNSNENSGTFRIYSAGKKSYLELTFDNQSTLEFELDTNTEGHTLLDGERYFVLDSGGCE
ncbi:MAG: hypothetical protein AAF466_03520 [Bacteroidota bacterium]